MSVDVAWGIVTLGCVCFLVFFIALLLNETACPLSKIRVAITIAFIVACVACLFVGCPVINADNARQCAIESIINGTPDNGYTIYYDGKPADLETRRIIKSMYCSNTYNDFNFKYDHKAKELWISEKDK